MLTTTAAGGTRNNPIPVGLKKVAREVVAKILELATDVGRQIVIDTVAKMLMASLGVPSV